MLFIVISLLPTVIALFVPTFRHISMRAMLSEVAMFYIAPFVYFVGNEFHRMLGVQKAVGILFYAVFW